MAAKPNIILITLDALRADHLSCMGYEKNTSPNLDTFSNDCIVFKNAFSVGPTTPYSFPAILTSTYPLDFEGPKEIKEPRRLISQVLQENGYITAAFHSSPYLSEYFGYNKGWDFFEDITFPGGGSFPGKLERKIRKILISVFPWLFFKLAYLKYRIKPPKTTKVRASVVNQAVKDFVSYAKNEDKPFFLWIHYMDTHTPPLCYSENRVCTFGELIGDYVGSAVWSYGNKGMLKRFVKNNFKKYLEETVSSYDRAISYLDGQVGELLSFFKKEQIYHDSAICITADHGDEFLEHGGIGHNTKLYNEVLHVPLLVKTPQSANKKIVESKVSLIDLAPTLFAFSGGEKQSFFKGKNLFDRLHEKEPVAIFHQSAFSAKENHLEIESKKECNLAIQTENLKYILHYETRQEELYDLHSDPVEKNDISILNTEGLALMRRHAKEFEVKNPLLQNNALL